jgi:hypothetical protein
MELSDSPRLHTATLFLLRVLISIFFNSPKGIPWEGTNIHSFRLFHRSVRARYNTMHADFILFFRNSKPISTKRGKIRDSREIPDFYHTKTGESLTFLTFTPTYGPVTRMAQESLRNPLSFSPIHTRKPSQNHRKTRIHNHHKSVRSHSNIPTTISTISLHLKRQSPSVGPSPSSLTRTRSVIFGRRGRLPIFLGGIYKC